MPPAHHLDSSCSTKHPGGKGWVGDESLLTEVKRVRPRLHVFGHFHDGAGIERVVFDRFTERYEDICRGQAGWWAIMEMGGMLLMAWFKMWVTATGRYRDREQTILVNAAVVGGIRDIVVRDAVMVQI